MHVTCKNKSDTTNNRVNWNHFKIIQTLPEHHTGKALNQGNAKKQPYWALHTYCRAY